MSMDRLASNESSWRALGLGVAMTASGGLALLGCSSGEATSPTSTTATAVSTEKAPTTSGSLNLPTTSEQKLDIPTTSEKKLEVSTTTKSAGNVTMTFDDLHGGSPIVKVYEGPKDTPEDRKSNGTFKDGQAVLAECKTEGRFVRSDTSVGEEQRSSTAWIRIDPTDSTPGETQYATAVYMESPNEVLSKLPNC